MVNDDLCAVCYFPILFVSIESRQLFLAQQSILWLLFSFYFHFFFSFYVAHPILNFVVVLVIWLESPHACLSNRLWLLYASILA